MGSPITLSGFNNIDFSLILNAIMQQERAPITQLEFDRNDLEGQDFEYGLLATKLADLERAVGQLSTTESFGTRAVANSHDLGGDRERRHHDPARHLRRGRAVAGPGPGDCILQHARRHRHDHRGRRWHPGPLAGSTVTITGNVTLQGLVDAINGTTDVPATASIMQTSRLARISWS